MFRVTFKTKDAVFFSRDNVARKDVPATCAEAWFEIPASVAATIQVFVVDPTGQKVY